MPKLFLRCVSWYLVFAMFLIGITPKVYAGFSPSDVLALSHVDRISDLERIQKILETKMIRKRLDQIGFSQHEIQTRLSKLNDQQIHQIALRLDEIRVGSSAGVVLGVLLLIGILFGAWLYFTGKRVVIENR